MKFYIFLAIATLIGAYFGYWYLYRADLSDPFDLAKDFVGMYKVPKDAVFSITSPAFQNGGNIPNKYSCDGGDLLPPFDIHNVPKGTRSLVFVIEDEYGHVYSLLYNIFPRTVKIVEGKIPSLSEYGTNSDGLKIYTSPCPPQGALTKYTFRVIALNGNIERLEPYIKPERFFEIIKPLVLARTSMVGYLYR